MTYRATPFARGLLGHALRWRARRDHGDARARVSPMWDDWRDGIWPDLAGLAGQVLVDDRVRPHSHLAALHSSMAFAFNLFLPFRAGHPLRLAGVDVDEVVFEWIPPGHLLGEIDGGVPREDEAATGVDVLLRGGDALVLVEVKLAEGGFTACGGRHSRGNRDDAACRDARLFLAEPRRCYLTRPVRKTRDRRYWEHLEQAYGSVADAFPGVTSAGCPFEGDAQQPMRQLALAHGLVQSGACTSARVALVHHDDNPDVVPHWQAFEALAHPDAPLDRVPASQVLLQGPGEWADWMRARYRLA